MLENLNYAVAGSKCGGDDGTLKDDNTSNCDTYGRLYNWATAMALDAGCNSSYCASKVGPKHRGICPENWHIPNNNDWNELVNFVESENGCTSTSCSAKYLKSTSGWNSNGSGEDKYGFSALPGGFGSSVGSFHFVGNRGYWWSASQYNNYNAHRRYMYYDLDYVYYDYYDKAYLQSVRCVQD